MGEIIDYIGWYADETLKPASRFSSWQPCYEHFGRQGVTSDRQTAMAEGQAYDDDVKFLLRTHT